jgi:DNA-binding beta-propeller fold protein YncE
MTALTAPTQADLANELAPPQNESGSEAPPPVASVVGRAAPPNKWWAALAVFFITLIIYGALVPRITTYLNPTSGDEILYLMSAYSIIEDFDINECNNFRQHDYDKLFPAWEVRGQPAPAGWQGWQPAIPYPLPPLNAQIDGSRDCNLNPNSPSNPNGPGELYALHGEGLSLLIAPALALGDRLGVVFFLIFLGALLAANIYLLAWEGTGRHLPAILTWLAFSFSVPMLAYSFVAFTEMPAALLLIYALRRIILWRNNWVQMLGIGLCIGFLPSLHYRYTPISVVLFAYYLYQTYRDRAFFRQRLPGHIVALAAMMGGAVLVIARDYIVYHQLLPGSELYEATYLPLVGFFGNLLDQQNGLFVMAPVFILTIVGIILMLMRRGWRSELLWLALLFIPHFALTSNFIIWWGSWSPPGRYLVSTLPLFVLPFALSLDRIRLVGYKIIYGLLMLPTLAMVGVYIYQPQWMYSQGYSQFFQTKLVPWLASLSNQSPDSFDLSKILPAFSATYFNTTNLSYIPSVRQAWATSLWLMGIIAIIVLLSFALYWWQGRKPRNFVFYTDAGPALRFMPTPTPLHIPRRLALTIGGALAALAVLGGGGYLLYKVAANGAATGVVVSAQAMTTLPAPTVLQPQLIVPAGALTLVTPRAIAVDPDGGIYIGDDGTMSITKYDSAGRFISSWPIFGGPSADKSRRLTDIAVDKDKVYVAVMPNRYIEVYSTAGKLLGQRTAGGSALLAQPMGLCLDGSGNLYVADSSSQRILKLDGSDHLIATIGASDTLSAEQRMAGASDCAVAQDGAIYATDTQQRVIKYNPDGSYAAQWQMSLNGDQKHLALAGTRLYISDPGSNSVVVLDTATGKVLTYGGGGNLAGQFTGLISVATDAQGRIYAMDTNSTWAQVFATP